MDVGSSTGLHRLHAINAALVYAADVGTNQLAWTPRNDHRVVSMEDYPLSDESDFDDISLYLLMYPLYPD